MYCNLVPFLKTLIHDIQRFEGVFHILDIPHKARLSTGVAIVSLRAFRRFYHHINDNDDDDDDDNDNNYN